MLAALVRAGGRPIFAVLPTRRTGCFRHHLLHGQDRACLQDRLGALADNLQLEIRLLPDRAAIAVLQTTGGAVLPVAVALPDDGRAHPADRLAVEQLGPGVHRIGFPEGGISVHRRLAVEAFLAAATDVSGPRHRLTAVVGPHGSVLLVPTTIPPDLILHAAR